MPGKQPVTVGHAKRKEFYHFMKKIKEWVRRGTALTLAVLLCLSGVPGTAWADIRTEPEKYAVHLGPCENGAVVFEGSEERTLTYAVDESVCLAPRADPGYILGSLDVADEYGNQILPDRENGRYIFLMPGADVTVSAVFYPREKPDVSPTEETTGEDGGGPLEGIAGEYTAALADTENGSVAFAGVDGTELGFYAGDTISLVMSADKGYEPG